MREIRYGRAEKAMVTAIYGPCMPLFVRKPCTTGFLISMLMAEKAVITTIARSVIARPAINPSRLRQIQRAQSTFQNNAAKTVMMRNCSQSAGFLNLLKTSLYRRLISRHQTATAAKPVIIPVCPVSMINAGIEQRCSNNSVSEKRRPVAANGCSADGMLAGN